jgi:hypothetical protein
VLQQVFIFTFLLFILNFLVACSLEPVRPWQKEDLAQPQMQFNATSTQPDFEQHFYFSKEGSSGGESFSGGGCGCN